MSEHTSTTRARRERCPTHVREEIDHWVAKFPVKAGSARP